MKGYFRIENHRLQPARYLPSPNFNERPDEQDISLLVIHNISLPPGQFQSGHIELFFQNKLPVDADPFYQEIAGLTVSAHLLIDRQGEVTQFVDFNKRAWHAGVSVFQQREACNDFSIGIELEGTDSDPFTSAQYQTLNEVTRILLDTYPKMSMEAIVGHSDIAPGRKTDPGPCFDWNRYKNAL